MQRPKQLWIYMLVVFAFALLVIMVMDFNSRVANLRRLTDEKEKVGAEKNSLLQTQSWLEERIAYATSPAAVENWAYDKGHMVRPGEIPVVPLQSGEVTPTPFTIQQATPAPSSNWDAWRELFLGR